ncbi:MAG: metal-dependent hydrolase [bacterium]
MDSITQITLGAAVGEAVLGRKVGNKAVIWGAAAGMIPDLDVLAAPLLSDVQRLTFHRGFSHSIVFAVMFAPILAYLIYKIHSKSETDWRDWTKLTFWSIFTHPLLDSFTNYGTQLFQPFSDYQVAFNTIFVVDPFYTVPFLISVIALMFFQRTSRKRRILCYLGLTVSSLYLGLTVVNKLYINHVFEKALKQQNISYQRYFTNPTPFNNLLWRGVVEDENGYYEGLYSLLDLDNRIQFRYIAKNHHLLETLKNHQEVDHLTRASKGFFVISKKDSVLYFNDLRFGKLDMGLQDGGEYLFSFQIDQDERDGDKVVVQRNYPVRWPNKKVFNLFYQRILGI